MRLPSPLRPRLRRPPWTALMVALTAVGLPIVSCLVALDVAPAAAGLVGLAGAIAALPRLV